MNAPTIQLTFDFQDDKTSLDQQEKFTQTLFQQMRSIEGVKVDRVQDAEAPEGSRAFGSFVWGVLQATVGIEGLKKLFGFMGDRLGNKPIKIKAKLPDGREYELEASSREELQVALETLEKLLQLK